MRAGPKPHRSGAQERARFRDARESPGGKGFDGSTVYLMGSEIGCRSMSQSVAKARYGDRQDSLSSKLKPRAVNRFVGACGIVVWRCRLPRSDRSRARHLELCFWSDRSSPCAWERFHLLAPIHRFALLADALAPACRPPARFFGAPGSTPSGYDGTAPVTMTRRRQWRRAGIHLALDL